MTGASLRSETPGRGLAADLLISLRPDQWTKNLLVFAGLVFGEQLLDPGAVARAGGAFGVFCALSSAMYLVNDVGDRARDRLAVGIDHLAGHDAAWRRDGLRRDRGGGQHHP